MPINTDAIRFVDSHVHLQAAEFRPHLDEILSRAADAGVKLLVSNGTRESDWEELATLARRNPCVVPCFGLHPWYAGERSSRWLRDLERYLTEYPSAVGEIGLDRWIEPRNEKAQDEVFRVQLDLARSLGRPAVIHCVRAWGRIDDVLRDQKPFPSGLLFHAFGGPVEILCSLIKKGAFFSFSGTALKPTNTRVRAAVRAVPRDRLLLETDAPDMLPPEPFRSHWISGPDGRPINEPSNLAEIARGVADLRGESIDRLAKTTWENAQRLFSGLLNEDRSPGSCRKSSPSGSTLCQPCARHERKGDPPG